MEDIYPIDDLFKDENLPDELYQLVLHRCTTELERRLGELPNAMGYLTALRWYGEEQLNLLMVAARNGHDEIVRLLLTCHSADEQLQLRGIILDQDQKRMNGVSAMYCACYRGHFHVAKTLIELGNVNVNEGTEEHPRLPLLLHAARKNRLDIVRFLVENRYAEVNETKSLDRFEFSALFHAARGGHIYLVQYLLDAGADVNYRSPIEYTHEQTALMLAVQKDHLELFVLLYHAGATISHSSLREAVNRKSYSILPFLFDESLITPDQLELEATSSLSWSPQIRYMLNCMRFLRISLEYRQRTEQRKVCPPPLSIYDYQRECQTVDELDSIADKRDRTFIEYLLVHDRLLPSDQRPDTIELLKAYSVMLVEKKRFDTCLDL